MSFKLNLCKRSLFRARQREVVIMDSAADSRLSSHQCTRKRLFRVTVKFAFLIHIKIYGLRRLIFISGAMQADYVLKCEIFLALR